MFHPPRGTQDYLPEEMLKRNWVIDRIRKVYESYGFEPLGTPAFERWDLLKIKSGEDIINQIYYFKDKSERELGLRFEWTASLARVISTHREIARPFKRFAMGPVWRYERPSEARRREFWQMDIDIVGEKHPIADAEILACAVDALKSIGFDGFKIKLNDRRVLSSFIQLAGMDLKNRLDIIRGVDKISKIGRDGVIKELSSIVPSEETITKLIDYLTIEGKSEEVLNQAKILLKSDPDGVFACDDLLTIIKLAKSFGYSEYIDVDLSLARGLDYYTGPVYEIYAQGNEDYGSIAGGGRYDEIIGLFGGENSPACGVSLGIERIMPLLKIKGAFDDIKLGIEVYIAIVNNNLLPNAIEISQILRQNGIITSLSYKSGNLSRQLKFADKKRIPYVIVIGDKELSENSVSIRNMDSGEQKKVTCDKIVDHFKIELKDS